MVHNSSTMEDKVSYLNTVRINMKVVDLNSVHEKNKEGDQTAIHNKVDVESAEVMSVKHAKGDSIKTNNREGGHALKSRLPAVQGGTLHGSHHGEKYPRQLHGEKYPRQLHGGEVSQRTSFEVPPEVGGGHALLGAQPDEVHQGVTHPHHPDVGRHPTNDVKEQFAMRNTYEKSAVELYYVKTAVGKQYEAIRNEELPQHRALSQSSYPEHYYVLPLESCGAGVVSDSSYYSLAVLT